jgi:hypothetical protein
MNLGIIGKDSVREFENNAKLAKFNNEFGNNLKIRYMTNNRSFVFNIIITCFHIYISFFTQ